ncbi:MAG: group II intron reverse transcriptase/maturase [Candidatus Peribacteraceae bacterium]|nr:group II intron reverse transcriptase/maturase [Candidatus Peribacteraceae bacterium]
MLAALENGVQGGTWFSLMDKVYAPDNLRSSFEQVKRNRGGAGVDHQTIEEFEKHMDHNLTRLHESLKGGTYRPQAIKRTWIPKAGGKEMRPLGIPTVRDRVAQTALRNVMEPIFERDFAEHSYGFRPGRGCKDALRRVRALLDEGYHYVVDADMKKYFDTIPHERLMQCVKHRIADGSVTKLLWAYLEQRIMDTASSWTPEEGTPQGAVISPLLSNIYLDELDHLMAASQAEMVRYADDFVILCRTQAQAEEALNRVRAWTAHAGLTLHPEKTHIVDATQRGGFDFLGYHFERGMKWPRKKSLEKFKDTIRSKTRRTHGSSMERIIATLNPTLRGWYEYFKHSHWNVPPTIDGWVRMRLRSILRKRAGRTGRGRGNDHQRWPNAYFAQQGLFSLQEAYTHARQPLQR